MSDWPKLAPWAESVLVPRAQYARCAGYRSALEKIADSGCSREWEGPGGTIPCDLAEISEGEFCAPCVAIEALGL